MASKAWFEQMIRPVLRPTKYVHGVYRSRASVDRYGGVEELKRHCANHGLLVKVQGDRVYAYRPGELIAYFFSPRKRLL